MGKLVKISATLVAMVFLIALVGCDEPTDTPKAAHNHVWSDWKHDTTKHWKECSCGTKTEEGNHAFENNKCKTCGYDKTIAVTSVTLSEKTLTLAAGGTKKLSAVVEPDDASSKTVTWESSNEAVATVGTDGTVTAVAEGDAKITAKAGDQKAECAVTVTKATPAESTHTHSYVGATWETSESEHWKECTADGCGTGALKGIAEKGVHEYNEASETPNNCTVCNYVRTVAVKSVTLDSITLSFKVGETKKLTATIAPANATNKTVTWESSNEGIAKVDQSGNVEAMGEGSATITAEADGKKGECSVTIIKAPQPDPEHQHNYNTENWSNDDTNHWNQCTAEGCTELGGKVNLAPHDWDNDNNKCTVCQKEKPVVPITGVVIDNEGSTIRIEIDGPITLTAHVNPAEADQAITWSSDKKDVANVSENGVVTGYKGGTATITAKAAGDETKTADRIIKVSCATHNYGSYTDNENGTHSAICEVCDKELKAEAHQIESGVCTKCGAQENISYEILSAYVNDKPLVGNTEYTTKLIQTFKKSIEVVIGETKDSVTLNFNKSKRQIQQILDANSADESKGNPIYLVLETNILDTVTAGDDTPEAGKFVFTEGYGWDEADHSFNFKAGKIMLWLPALKDKMEIKYQVDLGKEQTITINYRYKEDDTVKIATIIKGISDVKTMEGTNLKVYQDNLNKYDFVKVKTLSDGNCEVTCEVNVTELQLATDGGAKNSKNILAVVTLNKIEGFTIGNITSKQSGKALTDASWVSDAHLFVEGADDNKTYVTLWMSMEPGDDGKIPDRTYKIRAYEGDPNSKTLTFKFNDTSPAPEYKITKAEVENMQINSAENKLVKAIAESVDPNVMVEDNTVTVTFNKTKAEMRKLISDEGYKPFAPLYLVLETNIPNTVEAGDSEAAAGKFVFTKGYGWDDAAHHEFNFKDGKIMLWLPANGDNEITFKVGDVEKTITIKYEYNDGTTTEENKKIEVLKRSELNNEVETITGGGAEIYTNNLDYYDFDEVKTLSSGNYEVTCKVDVANLKEAVDGGAVGYRNIVGVVAFSKIDDFAIESVSKVTREKVTELSDASWVNDASKFVKNADDSKTYVTLWMSMKRSDNGQHSLSDKRTYEFKLDGDVRTLTVNFEVK